MKRYITTILLCFLVSGCEKKIHSNDDVMPVYYIPASDAKQQCKISNEFARILMHLVQGPTSPGETGLDRVAAAPRGYFKIGNKRYGLIGNFVVSNDIKHGWRDKSLARFWEFLDKNPLTQVGEFKP